VFAETENRLDDKLYSQASLFKVSYIVLSHIEPGSVTGTPTDSPPLKANFVDINFGTEPTGKF